MAGVDSNWGHIEQFADRFRLAAHVREPEMRVLFEPSIDFAASLIDLVGELDARGSEISGFDQQNARDNLIRSAQHLIEAVIAALAGMYVSGNVIYRLSVEATLQSMYTDAEVLHKMEPERRATIQNLDWDIGAGDYRRVLCRTTQYRDPTNRLYTVYRTLSKVAHGDQTAFAKLDQHLHQLPRFVPEEARYLQALLLEGNAAAGALIRRRFQALFRVAHMERVANFDRLVGELERLRPSA
jgi:hypothetical protein